jgi:hypothetical protein
MAWNYRLVQETKDDVEYIHLAEVYYDSEGKPNGWCMSDFNHYEDVRQAENSIHLALGAFNKPIIKYVDGKLVESV